MEYPKSIVLNQKEESISIQRVKIFLSSFISGRYYGYIRLKDAVWKTGMADNTSKDYYDFLAENNELVRFEL